jgi:protein-tyrosine phosphatase
VGELMTQSNPSSTGTLLASVPNFRDMGGIQTADGRTVMRGMLYRSEAISRPPEEDLNRLRKLGITLVCDLRGHNERLQAPNDWCHRIQAEILEMDLTADFRASNDFWVALRDEKSEAGGKALMMMTYRAMPAAAAAHIGSVFDQIATGKVPLLIHCTAGKDRTGLFAALILFALGVPLEAIYTDYLRSAEFKNLAVIVATRALLNKIVGFEIEEAALNAITGVDKAYLEESFFTIQQNFGSIDTYLTEAAGLDDRKLKLIQARLLR